MTSILLHEYYYRFKEHRKQAKTLVDNQDYTLALSKLTAAIQEHETKYPDSDTRRDFNFGEKIMMKHAKNHLEAVIDHNDPSYMDGDGNIKHQSDIVKEALERVPKQDYSDD